MRVFKFLVFGTIGFLLGLGLWKFGNSGYTQEWEKLPAPPQVVTELIPTGDPPLFIKTLDGNTYYLSYQYNEGWIQEAIPEDLINPFEVTRPCNFSFPEFSLFSNAPENIRDCIQETTMYADGYIKYAFVIDGDGNTWQWQHTVSPEDLTPMFCFPFLGLSIGLLVAFALVSKNNAKEK